MSSFLLLLTLNGCNEASLVTTAVSNDKSTSANEINMSLVDSRIKFDSFNDFAKFVELNEGSRFELINQFNSDIRKNANLEDTSKYVITSELIRSIANDDNMYQIGEKVIFETYSYQYSVHEDNISLLYDEDRLNQALDRFLAFEASSVKKSVVRSVWQDGDISIFPIGRNSASSTSETHPCDEIGGTADENCDDGSVGLPNPDPDPEIRFNVNHDYNIYEMKVPYYNNTYQATFRGLYEHRDGIYEAEAYVKHEKSTKVLGVVVTWDLREANMITLSDASISLLLENGAIVSSQFNIGSNFGLNRRSLHSSSRAVVTYDPGEIVADVISQGVLARVNKNVTNDITYQIERVIGFDHAH